MMRGLGEALKRLCASIAGTRAPRELVLAPREPIALPGPWPWGMALARHSRPEGGSEDDHTEVGALLCRFKYGGERGLARVLGELMARELEGRPECESLDVVTHVPAARRRSAPEPACELAFAVARTVRVRFLPRLIGRTRRMALQKDLVTAEEKRRNVAGAFRVRRADLVSGRKVLLVDDVYDSGATLEEGWGVLMEAGAREVVVATATKTRYRWDEG